MSAVAVGALLFSVFLLIVAVMVWQGVLRRRDPGPVLYVLDDAAEYVHRRLPAPARERLDPADVGRILEWEMEYHRAGTGSGPAVIGDGEAIEFVLEQAAAAGRSRIEALDVARVMAGGADYLAAIGALAGPAGEEQP
jgi:hypothetical protein